APPLHYSPSTSEHPPTPDRHATSVNCTRHSTPTGSPDRTTVAPTPPNAACSPAAPISGRPSPASARHPRSGGSSPTGTPRPGPPRPATPTAASTLDGQFLICPYAPRGRGDAIVASTPQSVRLS